MCDLQKYNDIFKEIEKLDPDDTMQLILKSESEDEKIFYGIVGDFLLQRGQKEAIARNVY